MTIRARATSAAPPYFKPFQPQQSGKEFIDGAVRHNNPIKVANAERKYIWPDVGDLDPDVLLSIGTGKSSRHLKDEEEKLEKQQSGVRWSKWIPKIFQVVFATVNDVLDAERTWQKFHASLTKGDSSQRYIRINAELNYAPPALDEKGKIWSLEADTKRSLVYINTSILDVADRLVASCFYFDKAEAQPVEYQITGMPKRLLVLNLTDIFRAKGQIHCRFEEGSDNLRHLGAHLRSFQSPSFSPYFTVIDEFLNPSPMDTILIANRTIHDMENFATFSVNELTIHISGQHARTTIALVLRPARHPKHLPISGFPRQLGYEDEISSMSSVHLGFSWRN